MSGPRPDFPSEDPMGPRDDEPGAARRSVVTRSRFTAPAIVLLWIVVCAVMALRLGGRAEIDGDMYGLVPERDRPVRDEPLLLLRLANDDAGAPDSDRLIAAAAAVDEALAEERVPIAPPRAEIGGWIDAHVLYLLPADARQTIAARLTDDAMAEAVESLRAQLSSPLFGVGDDDPRRDPLGLQSLGAEATAAIGRIGRTSPRGAEATATGDLLAKDGASLVVGLRSRRPIESVAADIAAAVADPAVRIDIIAPAVSERAFADRLAEHTPRVAMLVVAGLAIVLALALRAIRPVLAILLSLCSAVLVLVGWTPPLDAFGLALVILLLGFGCESALHLQRISARGWPGAAVMGTALLPMWMSPYPTWRTWSFTWLVGIAIIVATLRVIMPALITVLGGPTALAGRGFRLRPSRRLAVALSIAALVSGAWATERLAFRGFDRIASAVDADDEAARHVRDRFFDPAYVALAYSGGATEIDALERAALDTVHLTALVPTQAIQIDSPGRLVLPKAVIAERARALAELQLRDRMQALREILRSRGFRPDAFGEFLRSAADLERAPTTTAAIEGPLGHWIARYLAPAPDGFVVTHRVHLRPDPTATAPVVTDHEGEPIPLHGPAVAARVDRSSFADQLGIWVASQLWLGALFVWLGTRSLPVALATAITALTAQTAVLAVMVPLRIPLGPHLVPALLLVGASALVAGARACRSIDLGRPIFALGLLVTGLCQIVAGLALVGTGLPLWSQIGQCVAIGSSLACGAGLFIAPGLAKLFTLRADTDSAQPPDDGGGA